MNYSFTLYKIVKPERDQYGVVYKPEILDMLNEYYDISIKYYDDENNSYDNIDDYKGNKNKLLRMISYYSRIDGGYIGNPEYTYRYHQRGLTEIQKAHPDHQTCSIGYNAYERAYYGWSHRAMYSFSVGSKVKKGDCAYVPFDKDDFIQSQIDWYKSYNDIVLVHKDTFNNINENRKTVECDIERVKDIFDITNDIILSKYIKYTEKAIKYMCSPSSKKYGINIEYGSKDSKLMNYHFIEYPKTYGKGEWQAFTLDDAKLMAIDFAKGVS